MMCDREDDDAVCIGSVDNREGEVPDETRRVLFEAGEPVSGNAAARVVASSTAAVKRAPSPGSIPL
jgi:hypothetical protein